jgi:hypothetical protein
MIKSPGTYYRQLRMATLSLLVLTLVSLGITMGCALMGSTQGVITFRSATGSAAYALAVVLGIYLIASLVRWLHLRNAPVHVQNVQQ